MKTAVYIIKVFFVITIASALIALLLSYYQVYCGNWGYLWGNAISIGVFASSLVALICEYIRYLNRKNEIEINSYKNLSLIYSKLKTIISLINDSYNKPKQTLATTFLQPQKEDTNDHLLRLSFDLDTYHVLRNSTIATSFNNFEQETAIWISNILVVINEIEIAINEDINDVYKNNLSVFYQYKIGQIEQYVEQQPHFTASSPHTNAALNKVLGLINDELFDSIVSVLIAISNSKSNNFDWKRDKERILKLI